MIGPPGPTPAEAAIGRPTPTARRLVEASVSPNTRRAYTGALRRLDAWLDGRELHDVTLAAYLAELHDTGRASSSASMTTPGTKSASWCCGAGMTRHCGAASSARYRQTCRRRPSRTCTASSGERLRGLDDWKPVEDGVAKLVVVEVTVESSDDAQTYLREP